MVGWCEGVLYLTSPRHPTDIVILAYSFARPALLVAGKGRGGMFLFLHFHSCSSFFSVPFFHFFYYLFYLFSIFLWETTQRVDVSLNPNTINLIWVDIPAQACLYQYVGYDQRRHLWHLIWVYIPAQAELSQYVG